MEKQERGGGDQPLPFHDQVVLFMEHRISTNSKVQQSPERRFRPSTVSNADDVSRPAAEPFPPTADARKFRPVRFSKPKSRFTEFHRRPRFPLKSTTEGHHFDDPPSAGEEDDEEEEEENFLAGRHCGPGKKRKVRWRAVVEWAAFVAIMACFIVSHTAQREGELWGLALWKWYLMALVVLCGRLVAGWAVGLLVFLVERNFALRERVLYFVYGLRKSVRNCIWLGLALLAWYVMFDPEVEEYSEKDHRLLWRVWRGLIAVTIGAVVWLVKIVLVKVLASTFHVATFFNRMKESVFHHVILEKLSGLPLKEEKGGRRSRVEELERLSRERASPFSVRRLVSYIRTRNLSTISTAIDRTVEEFGSKGAEAAEEMITSEWQARACARRIFNNVARDSAKHIEREDLLRFLDVEEVDYIFPLFEGAMSSGKINKSSFRNWVVRAYLERKALAHSLNDTKTAVQQLHKLASAIVIVIIIVISLLVMEVATTKVVFFVTSQLVLAGFMFGNTCKTIFESIIFVFVVHPFDVGDRCVIDGVPMVVEEMNILTTVFLRYDNEKIYYPNSALRMKPISNFKRSPEMCDSFHFDIDASTSLETFNAMKDAIRKYIENRPKNWQSKHSVVVKEIEDMNKMKVALYVTHTINFQDIVEKNNRRSELILELKKIFEGLGIKYKLLPQEVHLSQVYVPPAMTTMPIPPSTYPMVIERQIG